MTKSAKRILAAASVVFLTQALPLATTLRADYTGKMTIYNAKGGRLEPSMTMKVFGKGNKMRVEMTGREGRGGTGLVAIADHDSGKSYMLMAQQRMAMKSDLKKIGLQYQECNALNAVPCMKRHGFTKTGSETVAGHACDVYSKTERSRVGGGHGTVWIAKNTSEKLPPLRVETRDTAAGPVKGKIEFSDFVVGNQPASLFELPAGYRVIDMPAMGGAMPLGR